MPRKAIIILSLLFSCFAVLAQRNDTLLAKEPKPHSPRKASIMSAVLPGLGQAYNKKYWKIPIIYGGFAGLGYAVVFNNREYNLYKDAYIKRVDEDSTTVDQFDGIYTDANLLDLQDYYRRNRDLAVIGVALLYVMNIIDATVDAHLYDFDVSDNLSMRLEPAIHRYGYEDRHLAGFKLTMKLK